MGLDIMDEQFTTYGSADVMVANITPLRPMSFSDRLTELKGVQMLDYDDTTDHYNKDAVSALYSITFDYPEDDDQCLEALDRVKEYLADYDIYVSTSLGNTQQETIDAEVRVIMVYVAVIIVIVLLLLFRNYREPVIILLMIPLIFIGVVLGLAVTGKVFNFFSLLGLLGLVGMNIKNAVVLVEQIGVLRAGGRGPYDALVSATRSRIVPVAMASGTTILGMLPLLFDSMFGAMAATIMGGLLFSTFATLFFVPVLYAMFFKIRIDR